MADNPDPKPTEPAKAAEPAKELDDEELLRLRREEEERKRIEALWAAATVLINETANDKIDAFLKQMKEYKDRFEEDYTSKVVKMVWRHRVGGQINEDLAIEIAAHWERFLQLYADKPKN